MGQINLNGLLLGNDRLILCDNRVATEVDKPSLSLKNLKIITTVAVIKIVGPPPLFEGMIFIFCALVGGNDG